MDVSSKTIIRFVFMIFFLFSFFAHSVNVQAEDQISTKTVVVIERSIKRILPVHEKKPLKTVWYPL